MNKQQEALRLALEALGHLWLFSDEAAVIANPAITALREALAEQPAKQDIPDLIAGTLGVSRGTAYDLMREALAQERSSDEQPAPVQEPVAYITPLMEQQMFDDWCPYKGSPDPRIVWAAAVEAVNGLLLGAIPPAAQRKPLTDEQQIAEALRQHGLTLVKTSNGYAVLRLGQIDAHGITGETK